MLPPLKTPNTIDIPTRKPEGSAALLAKPNLRLWRSLRFWAPRQSTISSRALLARLIVSTRRRSSMGLSLKVFSVCRFHEVIGSLLLLIGVAVHKGFFLIGLIFGLAGELHHLH